VLVGDRGEADVGILAIRCVLWSSIPAEIVLRTGDGDQPMLLAGRGTAMLLALAMAFSLPSRSDAGFPAAAQTTRLRVLIVHGPNLNLLGRREPQIYGTVTLDQINTRLGELARELDIELVIMQSNS
jgi:Dehydroquinase class II